MTTRVEAALMDGLTDAQARVVSNPHRRLLVVAGAGSGKTEVMSRRVAWSVLVNGTPRDQVVAFTFTEAAAEELKFRVRRHFQLASDSSDATLGGMYVGTIHGFCLKTLRQLAPTTYHNYDVLDDSGRLSLVQMGFDRPLALRPLKDALATERRIGTTQTTLDFLRSYDLLNEYDIIDVELGTDYAPDQIGEEGDWCKEAWLLTNIGSGDVPDGFGLSAARYYAYLRARRFMDFSTAQSELTRLLRDEPGLLDQLREGVAHLVVDEVQDVNQVQLNLVREIVGDRGQLTAVGDHRQAIYSFRGSRVDLMGQLHRDLSADHESEVVNLQHNFRSTPRILAVANAWADTISAVGGLANPPMQHGNSQRDDDDDLHVALTHFDSCEEEADWIAAKTAEMVGHHDGAWHDRRGVPAERGIRYSDIAVLLRSSTDARTFMRALRQRDIPVVVRAGPDLLRQPEVLLFVGCLGMVASIDRFLGGFRGLPPICEEVLGVEACPAAIIQGACEVLAQDGLPLPEDTATRLSRAAGLIGRRLEGERIEQEHVEGLRASELQKYLSSGRGKPRARVFPQRILNLLLAEAEIGAWYTRGGERGKSALFHVGQLSALIKGLETPGWVPRRGLRGRLIGLFTWAAVNARPDLGPLLAAPDAVTVTTVHSAKGLEWPAVFVADVRARRFPTQRARTAPVLLFDEATTGIRGDLLADNDNYDNERRLLYVALTRAERYLFVSASGRQRSRFFRELEGIFDEHASQIDADTTLTFRRAAPHETSDTRLATSFSDLRYYIECPHDFYLRKVLGFAPGIEESFGYGRGVHNLLREVHMDPKTWTKLATDPKALNTALQDLIDRGLVYLRYTTGAPADAMKHKAREVVADYVRVYCDELSTLDFEPEREFETLIPEANALISGAIDIVRHDDPPHVTLIDFKSGHAESDVRTSLNKHEMRLQISIYALAARHELEYEPEQGLVRYLSEPDEAKRQLHVPLDASSLAEARNEVLTVLNHIRSRRFHQPPSKPDPDGSPRCNRCDFVQWCGLPPAEHCRGSA